MWLSSGKKCGPGNVEEGTLRGTGMVREGFLELIKWRSKTGQSKRGGEGYKDMILDRWQITCQGQEVSVSL